jgi:hypothetical protein
MDSKSLARLEWKIYTTHLQIPPHACPPNLYWLLGLAPKSCEPSNVRWAGQQRIAYLRSIADPVLQPAIPLVIAKIESAMKSLMNSGDSAGDSARLATPVGQQPDGDPSSRRLIQFAAVLGGGTMLVLIALIMFSRWRDSDTREVAQRQETTAPATTAETPPAPPVAAAAATVPDSPPAPTVAALPPSSPSSPPPTSPTPIAAPLATPTTPATSAQPMPTTPMPMPPPRRDLSDLLEDAQDAVAEQDNLPEAVDLLSLVTRTPAPLFTLASVPMLNLDSGASRVAWELKPAPDANGQAAWAVMPPQTENRELIVAEREPIGWFLVTDNELCFRWASEWGSPAFNQLRNCVLELKIDGRRHRVALRTPQEIEPLPITLNERREKIELPTDEWPPMETLFVEILHCTGFREPPSIRPEGQRVSGRMRGAVVLPGWSRAEITFGLAGSSDEPIVLFESFFYLNNSPTELTRVRVQQTLENLKDNLEREQQALANYQERGKAALRDAETVSNSMPTGAGSPQAFLAMRDRQLSQLAQEIARCKAGAQRMRVEIPRTQEAIASVERLVPQLDVWTRETAIHWRVGATTDRGEITLLITRP